MEQFDEIWEMVISELKNCFDLSDHVINLWIRDAKITEFTESEVVLTFSTEFKMNIVKTRYDSQISEAFNNVIGFDTKISYSFSDEKRDGSVLIKPEPSLNTSLNNPGESKKFPTSPEYTFDSFIVGSSNSFVYAACIAVAEHPASEYNPLFIYGSSGLGKTHLLNAIMNEISKKNPNVNFIYVKGEDFTNEMIDNIAHKSQEKFREKYRKADVLLVDDIQFIAGKESTQEEFFHTFNALYEDHKQIIMTSDRPPRDIKTLEDRLKTRFEWGLIADIQPPDFELRIAIIKNKTKLMDVEFSDEVCKVIAENLKSNIRQLEGAIKKISASSYLSGQPITVEMAKECIKTFINTDESDEVVAKKIVSRVAKKYGISEDDIYSKKRNKPIANARNISMYLIREITELTLQQVGKMFDRDHSTVISSISVIKTDIHDNPLFEIEIKDLYKDITE